MGKLNPPPLFLKKILTRFFRNAQCIPPEVVESDYNSEKAEVWILGIYLYNLLTGKYPFQASNDQRLFKRMVHTTPSLPNELSQGNRTRFYFYFLFHFFLKKNTP